MFVMPKRSHGHTSQEKVVYDSLGNRRFRVMLTLKLGERLQLRAKDECIAISRLVASAIAHWVVRGCPNPLQERDHPKVFMQDGRSVFVADKTPSRIYPCTIWLHQKVHGPAIDALTRYRKQVVGNMGEALFPVQWLSRIVAAFLDDDWRGFTDAPPPQGTPPSSESSDQPPQQPVGGGGG
jgi:hypothetical protein